MNSFENWKTDDDNVEEALAKRSMEIRKLVETTQKQAEKTIK